METIKLTKYSHGSGCGCKIAPQALETILRSDMPQWSDPKLLVGNNTRDDAAVYDLGNNMALINTVDFFMPIVDDAFDFGRIASANAISDVYAMGGKPLLATAILGWPVDKLPAELAQRVLDGARTICAEAGIPLAGGHSIDSLEPMFGLCVNGLVPITGIKKNAGAKAGDYIYITKPLGIGILSTAQKRDVLKPEHLGVFIQQLTQLNAIGEKFGQLNYVHAMTDITGFGLLGHLVEMCEGAGVSAEIDYPAVPLIEGIQSYIAAMIIPDNTYRNWNSYEKKIQGIGMESLYTLCDPQTNGGLMVAVSPEHKSEFESFLADHQLSAFATPVARILEKQDYAVQILKAR
ncbi:MAG: selenide, water dikinase SelD [Bacteroidetes bacterium]|nr:selenide, water dikinase SelD [Bacteroidota bacterium]